MPLLKTRRIRDFKGSRLERLQGGLRARRERFRIGVAFIDALE